MKLFRCKLPNPAKCEYLVCIGSEKLCGYLDGEQIMVVSHNMDCIDKSCPFSKPVRECDSGDTPQKTREYQEICRKLIKLRDMVDISINCLDDQNNEKTT